MIILSLNHQALGLGGLARRKENDKTVFTDAEYKLIDDLISDNEQGRNYIFEGSNLDIYCSKITCEKYSVLNFAIHLSARGERIYSKKHTYDGGYAYYHEIVIKNAGSSERNIIVFKLASLSNEDVLILDMILELMT